MNKFILAILFVLISNLGHSQLTVKPNLVWAYAVKIYDGDGGRLIFLSEKPTALPASTKAKDWPKGKVRKVRFTGVDAPDFKNAYVNITATQPWAKESRDSLRSLILYKYILVDTMPYGRRATSYDRLIVDVYVPEQSPSLLNYYIVAKGWAWFRPSPRKDKNIEVLMDSACKAAQEAHVGMFSQKVNGRWYKNVLPATWRATHRK